VDNIIAHCRSRVDDWVAEAGGLRGIEALESLVTERLQLVFEEVRSDEDFDRLTQLYAREKKEFIFGAMRSKLDDTSNLTYGALVERRHAGAESQLDQYYFDALTRVLECADQTYVRGYQIWEHEIEWRDHRITRRGYLFFGAPNKRSTAQPPRDFYLYFLQPFEPPYFEDQKLADEVFFKLTHRDKQFEDTLRLYAGAREMAALASTGTKKVYEEKADGFLKTLVAWLRTNMLTSFEVVHQGVPKKTGRVAEGPPYR
jgi:Family of unknown function (DUF6079)